MLQGTKEKIPNTTSLGPLPIRRAKPQMFQPRRRGTEATSLAPWLGTQESSLYLQERDRQKDGERQREGGREGGMNNIKSLIKSYCSEQKTFFVSPEKGTFKPITLRFDK